MPRDSDDEALSWAGDDEPALSERAVSAPGDAPAATAPADATVAPGWKVVGNPGTTAGPGNDQPRGQIGSVALVAHGVIAGIYLLYSIGWLIVVQRDTAAPSDIIGGAMYGVGLWLAVLAPALWFGATLWLTRASVTSRARLIALAVGAIVLAPVPFLLGGAA
ncbi:hypothetical protein [Mycetocola zhujimingii]|uniref:hypothetical protein n=1 Tax=Mycetocola zhujimingii TaxID=2079792 RepID=UPI000D3972B2|nr:hypothetical protein [Mycetocola zhujimingii]AWB86808.1 hypothetical protein C3E77_09370 [Mycetocola zhujimingii]